MGGTKQSYKQNSIDQEIGVYWSQSVFTFTWFNIVAGKYQVNCNISEQPGAAIHDQFDKNNLPNPDIKHRVCINSLMSLFNVIKIDGKQVSSDLFVLLNQLTVIVQREDDV